MIAYHPTFLTPALTKHNMPPPKGSRNAAHGEQSYDKRINVPMMDSDREWYKERARAEGKSLSAVIRELLEDRFGRRP